MKSGTVIGLSLVAVGGYFAWDYLKKNGTQQMAYLEAHDKWEMLGYINGLMRGAGSYNNAIDQIVNWKDYWLDARPELTDVITEWYHYGQQRADALYPNG